MSIQYSYPDLIWYLMIYSFLGWVMEVCIYAVTNHRFVNRGLLNLPVSLPYGLTSVTLMLVLPYHPAERPIEKPPGYDGTYYPESLEKTPRPFAIVKANQLMVDTCEWLICYVRHGASNSRNLLEYAQRRGKKELIQIINIAEEMGTNL